MAELDDIDDVVDVVDNGLDSVVPEGPEGEVEFERGSRWWRKRWHWQSAPGTTLCHIRPRVVGLMGKTLPCWRCSGGSTTWLGTCH